MWKRELMLVRKKKFCSWLYENRWLITAFVVPIVILWGIYAFLGVTPFGNNHILVSDAKHQYFPFLLELREKLRGQDNLFYSWYIGLGENFWSVAAYYLLSPLNILAVIAPEQHMLAVYFLIVTIKMGAISLFFAIFLKKMFGRNDLTIPVFSCMYAFSAYFMGYYWNTIWLDSIAMLPLVILGLYALVKEGRFKLFVVSLALSMIFNYLIGVYLCIFVFFSFFAMCICLKTPWNVFWRRVCKIAICALIAIGMAAVFLLPTFFSIAATTRAQAAVPVLTSVKTGALGLASRFCAAAPLTFVEGPPNYYCGIVCLLLAVVYLGLSEIPLRQKLCAFALLLFVAGSGVVEILEYMWNGMRDTKSLPGRFLFLVSFLVITIAYQALQKVESWSIKKMIPAFAVGAAIITVGFVVGGKRIAVINGVLVLALVICVLVPILRKWDRKHIVRALSAVVAAEVLLSAAMSHMRMPRERCDLYPEKGSEVAQALKLLRKQDDGFYRSAVLPLQTSNDPVLLRYRGATAFQSLINGAQLNTLNRSGYASHSAVNRNLYSEVASPLTNILLNMKYIVMRDGEPVDTVHLEQIASEDGVSIYQNQAVVSVGFMANDELAQPLSDAANGIVRQNELFCAMTGLEKELFTCMEHEEKIYTGLQITPGKDGMDHYVPEAGKKQGTAAYVYTMPRDGMVYSYIYCNDIKDAAVVCGEEVNTLDLRNLPMVACAGFYKKGQQIKLTWTVDGSGRDMIAYAGVLDEDVLQEGLALLKDEPLHIETVTSNTLRGTIDVKQPGYFYTSIPYDAGWTMYVDGIETEITPYQDAFVALEDLQPGQHTIVLRFVPRGLVVGSVISFASVLLFVFVCIADRKKKR